jgi:uncharacterized repeat protein (TIGR01451 family)
MLSRRRRVSRMVSFSALVGMAGGAAALTVADPAIGQVTYKPYIQLGGEGGFGPHDQIVIAWQTDESSPSPGAYSVEFEAQDGVGGSVAAVGRVIDNYLAADPSLPVPPTAPGPRVNYVALLSGLEFDTEYTYRVLGPGLPADGFRSTFHTRKRGGSFSFLVQGDEGFFPGESSSAFLADFEARIVHLMNDVQTLRFPGEPPLPDADLALNAGDNVYTFGSEGSYRDFWMPVWNNDVSSNETGAPFIRHKPVYIVAGNHDVGSTGVNVNLLGSDTSGPFTGNEDGGDALVYYNHFYYPLNGPTGVDPQFTWNADQVTANGFLFSFKGSTFTSPAAIEALRASSSVLTAAGATAARQIDHMSNYSFDTGNAHFLFLDANPHLFDGILDGASVSGAPPDQFPAYPTILRQWVIDDLDSSHQTWKVVVFHQPAFSSGLATLRNSQMRAVAKVLEDHGVNVVFNGHEHNYQRTRPLRALATVAAPASPSGPAAVAVDETFDGVRHTTPDGVLYLVEGAGGNRDFDGDEGPARGSGTGLDQDDSATGTFAVTPTLSVSQGPSSWLDTHLTDTEMQAFAPGAGTGPKITVKFKAKVFSFGQVVVHDNELTLYQISEPLQNVSTATAQIPAPFGTDINGNPLNNPIPDTLVDPTTGDVVSPPATGTSALLDKFTIAKADLGGDVSATVTGPQVASGGATVTFDVHVVNRGRRGLNGTQVVFFLPEGTDFAGAVGDDTTVHGREVVATMGRLNPRSSQDVSIPVSVNAGASELGVLAARAIVRSSTAQPVTARPAFAWRE